MKKDTQKPSFDLLTRLQYAHEGSQFAVPIFQAALIGCTVGLVIVAFIFAIQGGTWIFFNQGHRMLGFMGRYWIVLTPAIGGLLVGLSTRFFAPGAASMGIGEILKVLAFKNGRISMRNVAVKFIASVLSLGSGASTAREGPAVFIGAGFGSLFGKLFNRGEVRTKNLIACGIAAAISAAFNAPMTGMMFALEIFLKDFRAVALSTVVVAAVAASIISRIFLGESPAFPVPVYSLRSSHEMFLYLLLGALSAVAAVLFTRTFDRVEHFWEKLSIPDWVKPCAGGLLVGAIGVFFPQVLGMGFDTITAALSGNVDLSLFLALIFLKMIATSLSLGSGSSGGFFAPALFIGACLGVLFGTFFSHHAGFPIAPPGAYALVGMASVFAGMFHAPVTAILLVFEMTRDYQMILPLMVSAVVAVSVAQILYPVSIEHVKLKRQGVDVESLEEVRVLRSIAVKDAMAEEYELIPRDVPVAELYKKMAESPGKIFFDVNPSGDLLGCLTQEALESLLFEKDQQLFLADDVATPCHWRCFPEDPLVEAVQTMHENQLDFLPVVDRHHSAKVVGVLRVGDVFRAYTGLTGRHEELTSEARHKQTASRGLGHCWFILTDNKILEGKKISELRLPEGVTLTSVERGRKLMAPAGSTELKDRDKIWTVMIPSSEPAFVAWLQSCGLSKYAFFE